MNRMSEWAIIQHQKVNQTYDGFDYRLHLQLVAAQAEKWIYVVHPEQSNFVKEMIVSAAWCHDILEDTHNSYNDLNSFAITMYPGGSKPLVADIVYAVTNEKGRNRKERANDKYYQGIRDQEFATFVKLCDRLGNGYYSKANNSRQFKMYQKEHKEFIQNICTEEHLKIYQPIIQELERLFYDKENN